MKQDIKDGNLAVAKQDEINEAELYYRLIDNREQKKLRNGGICLGANEKT